MIVIHTHTNEFIWQVFLSRSGCFIYSKSEPLRKKKTILIVHVIIF